jgi:hypothetical protein
MKLANYILIFDTRFGWKEIELLAWYCKIKQMMRIILIRIACMVLQNPSLRSRFIYPQCLVGLEESFVILTTYVNLLLEYHSSPSRGHSS